MKYIEMIDKLGEYPEFEQDADLWWGFYLPGYKTEFMMVGVTDEYVNLIYTPQRQETYKFSDWDGSGWLFTESEIIGLTDEILDNFINDSLSFIKTQKALYAEKQLNEDFK